MARKKNPVTVPAAVLQFDAPKSAADDVGAVESAAEPVSVEVQPDAAAAAVEAPAAAAEPEHKDIGQWTATYWRGRALWRHKRTGQTMFKRSEVWRLRNLK